MLPSFCLNMSVFEVIIREHDNVICSAEGETVDVGHKTPKERES